MLPRTTVRVVKLGNLPNGIASDAFRQPHVATVLITQLGTTLEKRARLSTTALSAYLPLDSVKVFSAYLPPVVVQACPSSLAVLTDVYRPDTGEQPVKE